MSVVVACPHCRHPLSATESHAGRVVSCPACRGSLAIPSLALDLPDEPAPRRYRQRPPKDHSSLIAVGLVLGGFAVVAGGVAMWYETRKKPEPAGPAVAATSPATTPTSRQPTVGLPKPGSAVVPLEPTVPTEPVIPTFDEAWVEARELATILDREEPTLTRKAQALLNQLELVDAQIAEQSREFGTLMKLGCRDLACRIAREESDRDKRFLPVVKQLWHPQMTAGQLVTMMEVWGMIDHFEREGISHAVTKNTPTRLLQPDVRSAILRLGGEKWLTR